MLPEYYQPFQRHIKIEQHKRIAGHVYKKDSFYFEPEPIAFERLFWIFGKIKDFCKKYRKGS
jgi:hypothetical protein